MSHASRFPGCWASASPPRWRRSCRCLNRRGPRPSGGFPTPVPDPVHRQRLGAGGFWPTGGETDFTFKPGSITEPLAPYKSKLIFPQGDEAGLRGGGGGHESAMVRLWTGVRPQPGRRRSAATPRARRSTRSSPRSCRRRPRSPACSSACSTTARGPTPRADGHDLHRLGPAAAARVEPLQDVRPADARQRRRAHRHPARGAGEDPARRKQSVLDLVRDELRALTRGSTAATGSRSSSTWTGCRRSRSA